MTDLDVMKFWNRYDELLGQKNKTLTDLSSDTGIKYKTISMQRTRHAMPSCEQLYTMAEYVKETMEFLLTGKPADRYQFSKRTVMIAQACEKASDLELAMVEKILDIPPAGKNTDIQKAL